MRVQKDMAVAACSENPKSFYFLRLPTELRLVIYELLRDTYLLRNRKIHFLGAHTEPSKFALSITRVNREIRSESIPAFYTASQLIISFRDEEVLEHCRHWVDIVDPDALKNIRSFQFEFFPHYCQYSRRTTYTVHDKLIIDRKKEILKSVGSSCCLAKRADDEQRRVAVQEFLEESEWGRDEVKENVLELIKIVESFGGDGDDMASMDSMAAQVHDSPAR